MSAIGTYRPFAPFIPTEECPSLDEFATTAVLVQSFELEKEARKKQQQAYKAELATAIATSAQLAAEQKEAAFPQESMATLTHFATQQFTALDEAVNCQFPAVLIRMIATYRTHRDETLLRLGDECSVSPIRFLKCKVVPRSSTDNRKMRA